MEEAKSQRNVECYSEQIRLTSAWLEQELNEERRTKQPKNKEGKKLLSRSVRTEWIKLPSADLPFIPLLWLCFLPLHLLPLSFSLDGDALIQLALELRKTDATERDPSLSRFAHASVNSSEILTRERESVFRAFSKSISLFAKKYADCCAQTSA